MPIIIPDDLPAVEILQKENIFVMLEKRAYHQDIRPLRIVILNLMPTKIITETQILRLLGNSALQIEICLLYSKTHICRNTSLEHLVKFYSTIDDIRDQKFDGMIVTGAPVEHLLFEEVDYWDELKEIMDWSIKNVFSTMHLCWGAQAALYYRYGIPNYTLAKKMFGVFLHRVNIKNSRLLRGFDDEFFAPHSRHTGISKDCIKQVDELEVLSESDEAGVYIATTRNRRQVFVTGHAEYDPFTLKLEYERDIKRGLDISVPQNYFPDNNPQKKPLVKWRSHAHLLFMNWLNYYVYQETPYDLQKLEIPGGKDIKIGMK